ncbi:MAG: LOG family protein [Gammaproteobacteria bacterium]|nr:LOG family protein [Gammaproteobacteria bacterium]MCP4091605.1 LOG family protein [Gammaproteobacteria bacterium]MCP4276101.1 LOG family protein [Gammaproteobacteria bacterium]MCP4830845.1 LOG family protein [Gammaproteobacteria bacterium]MCP4929671.1 LOG family protein [Gammaproteobacteria bacterium]
MYEIEKETEFFVEVMPEGSLEVLSKQEVRRLQHTGARSLHNLLRCCALAVLNSGSETDSAVEMLEKHADFDLRIVQQDHGVTLALRNAPASAFVDGQMIRGIRELLFAVLRDIVFINNELVSRVMHENGSSEGITNTVFAVLRNAGVLHYGEEPDVVVCWGGHAIERNEYEYTKEVGYQLGLRSLNVCTGCGPGAMKGPMKGATIGHSKQRFHRGRYIGLTEPGIIAAEPPNPIVNALVILPDMEKRLEAFIRVGHAVVIFPGGVGTLEELLYLLGILLHPDNRNIPVPLVLTGPKSSAAYFKQIDNFIAATLGDEARSKYRICLGDPAEVGSFIRAGVNEVLAFRKQHKDAYFFNWQLTIEPDFQQPFHATHERMAALVLERDLEPHVLAANLRRAFSGLVAGNIREEGIRAIEKYGPFEIHGDKIIMQHLDKLLAACVEQGRMRLPGKPYIPCYRVIS